MKPGSGLIRGEDGILAWHGGRHYHNPGEAVKTWRGGVLRLGCNEWLSSGVSSYPCGCTPKNDPDANGRMTKCGRHSAAAKAKREAKDRAQREQWKAKSAARRAVHDATAALELALRQIADGHNDPRALAQEVIAAVDAARMTAKALGNS
jgi:hypothetical protein